MTGKNVQDEHTKKLWALTMVNQAKKDPKTKKSRPPRCEFHWGGGWSFEAIVTTISEQLTMFLPDGTPIRSQVDITLKQAKDPGKFPFQNPTSGGVPGHRTHIVRQAETLDWIAASEYGEARHWRHIAQANGLDNPMQLPPGMILQLPPLTEE
jgi:nucleoid-associated protein YgaU